VGGAVLATSAFLSTAYADPPKNEESLVSQLTKGMTGSALGAVTPAPRAFDEAYVAELMQRGSVEDILKEEVAEGLVTFVKYDAKAGKTDFDDVVLQENLKPEERKPALVMFYQELGKKGPTNREAIVFKGLANAYRSAVKFVIHNNDADPTLAANNHKSIMEKYSIHGSPAIAMYATFDVAKGEKPAKNGHLKQIDVLGGGPKENKQIAKWIKDFQEWWIDPNIFGKENPEKDGKLYRFLNTDNYQAVVNAPQNLYRPR